MSDVRLCCSLKYVDHSATLPLPAWLKLRESDAEFAPGSHIVSSILVSQHVPYTIDHRHRAVAIARSCRTVWRFGGCQQRAFTLTDTITIDCRR